MNRPTAVISCPIDTYLGYGARARDFVKAFIATEKYDVKILSQRWGNTRFGYLKDHSENELLTKVIPAINGKPDVWVQITVPNEFQPAGRYNIGVTAGMETTLVHPSWIEGINRMNVTFTSSLHSKQTFQNTKGELKDKQGNVTKVIKLEKPIEVLLEGADLDKYFANPTTDFDLSGVKEQFAFLFVGHWLQGDLGQDRKNVGYTIKAFLETFKNKPNPPALILKTQQVGTSVLDRSAVLKKINNIKNSVKGKLPNIYLVHGDLTDQQVNELYNHPKVKAMISFTKGEGFGRPLLEFSLTGKPIIASGWSGQVDFLDRDNSILIGGNLTNVHKSAAVKDMILEQSQWFTPDDNQVGNALTQMFKKYKNYVIPAKRLKNINKKNFSFDAMQQLLDTYLTSYVPELPKQVELKIPSLNLPKLQKL